MFYESVGKILGLMLFNFIYSVIYHRAVAMCPPALDAIGLDVSDEQVISFLDGFKIGSLLPKDVFDDINPFQFQPSNLPG